MLKLYRITDEKKEYWETWEGGNDSHIVHWGVLGTKGESKTVKSSAQSKAEELIQTEIDGFVSRGYHPIDLGDHFTLMIEYSVDGMGSKEDIEKRYRLENRMNEALGWTGLGACDGGSIGSGTMEVCCYVVDFEIARSVIEEDLAGTEFSNYTRIFDENAE